MKIKSIILSIVITLFATTHALAQTNAEMKQETEAEMKENFIDGDIRNLNQNEMERLQTIQNLSTISVSFHFGGR